MIVYVVVLFFCFLTPGSCRDKAEGVAGGGAIELVSEKGSISISNFLFQNDRLI